MAKSNQPLPGRNAPCPCGSGKKFKRCCRYMMTTFSEEAPSPRRRLPLAIGLVMVSALLLVGSLVYYAGWVAPRTPEAWYYDEANNRHWHAGHGHWHQGPPPPEHRESGGADEASEQADRPALDGPGFGWQPQQPPAEAPEPWYYDEANNRHWHAGHGHWHQGPPPPGVGSQPAHEDAGDHRDDGGEGERGEQ